MDLRDGSPARCKVENREMACRYPDGSNGTLYRIAAPMVNVSRAPGEWQSYDILHAP